MLNRLTIFHKVIIFIALLLIPIFALYFYSNRVSVAVVEQEITDSIDRRISFLQNQLNQQIDHLGKGAFRLGSDPILTQFVTIGGFESFFDVIEFKRDVEERIVLQNSAADWPIEIAVYLPKDREAIKPTGLIAYSEDYLLEHVTTEWETRREVALGGPSFAFYFYALEPYFAYYEPLQADRIVELKLSGVNLLNLLDNYKASGQGDPFLFNPEWGVFANRSHNADLTGQAAALLAERELKASESFRAELSGQTYLINYYRTNLTGWTIVDYVPMQQVLAPIVDSNRLFYGSMLLLLLMSLFAAFMLYRQVQIPIRTLIKSLRLVQHGDFTAHIDYGKNNEFRFVFQRFNDMLRQIRTLINNVYTEQLRARDAQLKQLQSQINPHFLYNCLYFIVNMARLERLEAIEKMAVNLGNFFKYTTRLEKSDTTVADELQLIRNYLEIQKLRLNRIEYEIRVPEEMMKLTIPRLLLQPIVENAVIHGIEPKEGGGRIVISGRLTDGQARLEIADNGMGMTEEQVEQMTRRLKLPMSESMGYGVWNVNQRLGLRFGEDAGVSYRAADGGGCVVALAWNPDHEQPVAPEAAVE